jgi:hypothetical protein
MKDLQKFKFLGIAVLIFLAIGCMSDEANRSYLDVKLPAKQISEVDVLRESPTRPYTVIADFQANNATIKHMRKRAAEVGADAVIIVAVGGYYSNKEVWASEDRYSNSFNRLIGTAIKYK